MNSQFEATVLGAVQGLTEFLPVSSSAHLVIIPWFFSWRDPGLAFDVALHLGTLLALLLYYGREWLSMLESLAGGNPEKRRLLGMLVVASLPGALVGLAFEKQAEALFRSPMLIAVATATLGVVLWFVDRVMSEARTMRDISYTDALLVGLSQALAIVPGVSRSGITITMARAMGIERADAANFSFLMATPIIAGAGLLESRKLLHSGLNAPVLVGFLAAAIFGLAAIAFLIRFVRARTYAAFAAYRILAALVIVAVFFSRLHSGA